MTVPGASLRRPGGACPCPPLLLAWRVRCVCCSHLRQDREGAGTDQKHCRGLPPGNTTLSPPEQPSPSPGQPRAAQEAKTTEPKLLLSGPSPPPPTGSQSSNDQLWLRGCSGAGAPGLVPTALNKPSGRRETPPAQTANLTSGGTRPSVRTGGGAERSPRYMGLTEKASRRREDT